MKTPLETLRHHVSGAIERGEAVAIVEIPPPVMVRVLSIDAWRESEGGWTWNNWHQCDTAPLDWCDLKPRALLRALRERGIISAPGRLAIEDDQYNVVVVARGTRRPLVALEYGAVQP